LITEVAKALNLDFDNSSALETHHDQDADTKLWSLLSVISSLGFQGRSPRKSDSRLASLTLALRNVIRLIGAVCSSSGSSNVQFLHDNQVAALVEYYVTWSVNFLGWLVKSLMNSHSQSQWKGDPLPLQVLLFSPTRKLLIGLCRCMMTFYHHLSVSAPTEMVPRTRAVIDKCPIRLNNLEAFLESIHVDNGTSIFDLQLLCASNMPSNWQHHTNLTLFSNLRTFLDGFEITSLSKHLTPPEYYGGQFIPDWRIRLPLGSTTADLMTVYQLGRMSSVNTRDKWQCTRCASSMRNKDAGPEPTPGLGYILAYLRRCPCGGYWETLGKQDAQPRRSIFMPLTEDLEEDSD